MNPDRIRQARDLAGKAADRATHIPAVGYHLAPRIYRIHVLLHKAWHRRIVADIERLEEHANGGSDL